MKPVLAIFSAVLVIFCAIFYYNYREFRKIIYAHMEEDARNIAAATVNRIEKIFTGVERTIAMAQPLIESNLRNPEELKEILQDLLAKNSDIFGSTISLEPGVVGPDVNAFGPYYSRGEDGTLVYQDLARPDYDYLKWDWYQSAKRARDAVWSEPFFDELIMITYSMPLYSGTGASRRFVGVVTADISLDWLEKLVSPIKVFKSGYGFLITSKGTFITHPNKDFIMKKTIFDVASEVKDPNLERIGRMMTAGGHGFTEHRSVLTGKDSFIYYLPLPRYGWSLAVVCSQEEMLSGVRDLSNVMLFLGFIGLGIFLWIIIGIIRKRRLEVSLPDRKSPAVKVILAAFAAVIVIFSIVFYFNYIQFRKTMYSHVEENAEYIAASTINRIQSIFTGVEKSLAILAPSIQDNLHNPEALKKIVRDLIQYNQDIFGGTISLEPGVIGKEGELFGPYYYRIENSKLAYTDFAGNGYDYFAAEWYSKAKRLGSAVWSEPYFDKNGGEIIMITYSMPIFARDGNTHRFVGVLTADISLDWLENVVSPIRIFKSGYGFLITSTGTFITHPIKDFIMKKTIFDIAGETNDSNLDRIGRMMIHGERGLVEHRSVVTGENSFIYYLPLPKYGWSLGIICPKEEMLSEVKKLTHVMFFLGFIGFGIFLAIIVIFAGTIIKTTYFTKITPWVKEENYRSFVVLNAGTIFGIGIHLTVLPLFILTGAFFIVAFNAISISSYLLALRLNRHGYHIVAVTIAVVELIIHQTLCVMYLGWDAGFQYYLLAIPGIIFFMPPGRIKAKLTLLVLTAIAFVCLIHHPRAFNPVIEVNASFISAIADFNLLAVFAMLGLFVYFYSRAAEIAEVHLEEERRKVEELLHAILPAPIAARLKDRRDIIADGFSSTTVLFADIVDFAVLADKLSPQELVRLLDELFSDFDLLADRHGLEKIKTIGDAYMAAAGVPEPMVRHADAAARMAIDMQSVVGSFNATGGVPLQLRIGMASGPLVAGVIGKRKFIYDLWGNTVNIASRMESHGIPGEIQISDETRRELGDEFNLVDRGIVEIKGMGEMHTWLIKGVKKAD